MLAPLNHLVPHPFFPSCCYFVFVGLYTNTDWLRFHLNFSVIRLPTKVSSLTTNLSHFSLPCLHVHSLLSMDFPKSENFQLYSIKYSEICIITVKATSSYTIDFFRLALYRKRLVCQGVPSKNAENPSCRSWQGVFCFLPLTHGCVSDCL